MDGVGPTDKTNTRPRLELDVALYQEMLDDPALTDAQKEQIIRALWDIIVAFVDLGYGVHPAQLAQNACGKLSEEGDVPALGSQDDVDC